MKIEAGKFYRTGFGRKVGPMRRHTDPDYPWVGEMNGMWPAYTNDGRWWKQDRTKELDLVAEWQDEPEGAMSYYEAVRELRHHFSKTRLTSAISVDPEVVKAILDGLPVPTPAEKPKRSGEVWVNVYPDTDTEVYLSEYPTREEADAESLHGRLACIRVQWTEGQFDD